MNKIIEHENTLRQCLIICDFLMKKSLDTDRFIFESLKDTLKDTFNKKRFAGLKILNKDINEMAKGLSNNDYNELNSLLNRSLNKSIEDEETIQRIIKRGKIVKDNEYHLLDEKVDELSQNQSNPEEMEILNKLLLAYQQSKG